MKRALMFGMVSLAMMGALAGACASSESRELPATQEAGPLVPGPDATSSSDAAFEAEAEAAPLDPCSVQGFCHTPLPPKRTLRAVFARAEATWAVTEEGDVLRWDGNAWNVHASNLGALYAVTGSAANDVWIGGEKGVYHGTGASPASVTFAPETLPAGDPLPIRDLALDGDGRVIAVGGIAAGDDGGAQGRVLLRKDVDGGALPDGGALSPWTVDPISSAPVGFWHVARSSALGVFVAGDDGIEYTTSAQVYRRAPDASTFAPVELALDPQGYDDAGVVGTLSALGTTGDAQLVFAGRSAVFNPSLWTTSAGDGGALVQTHAMRDLNDMALRAIWGTAPNDAWAAGDYGRLRHWDGKTWTQAAISITGYPVITPFYGIDGVSADDFWIVGKDIAIHYQKAKAKP